MNRETPTAPGPARVARYAAIAVFAALASCAPKPTEVRLYSVAGHVKLTGFLLELDGRFAGTRVVGDADGVPVELVYGDRVVARTTTVDGVYRFAGVAPGSYIVRARPLPMIADSTEHLTVVHSDLAVGDTLRLRSIGELTPIPNPIDAGTLIHFHTPSTDYVELKVFDMGGVALKTIYSGILPDSIHSMHWDGLPAPPSDNMFWVAFVAGDDQRAHLVFK